MKRSIRIVPISDLEPGSKFSLAGRKQLKGVVLHHSPMGTSVYWYQIPDEWKKINYDNETYEDKKGNIYLGLDTLHYRKKMTIGSAASVIEITDKQKGE